ncbi:hypothetical protein B0H16DRAFT_1485387 [Mycena metata]|uniref:Uncharacterized protein n=1 Tax=Mycena metata TaxID=1033252 RepID=A0AAD7GHP3_9AGAR|nr:hypothetical protein B0H16DRAFT_1485387 [Mycena metata]
MFSRGGSVSRIQREGSSHSGISARIQVGHVVGVSATFDADSARHRHGSHGTIKDSAEPLSGEIQAEHNTLPMQCQCAPVRVIPPYPLIQRIKMPTRRLNVRPKGWVKIMKVTRVPASWQNTVLTVATIWCNLIELVFIDSYSRLKRSRVNYSVLAEAKD